MALILKDRVKETATSPGTGSVTLLGASTGFQSFSVIGNGNTCYYTISDQGGPNWEVGIGTYSTTGPTLARTTVLASSNAGSLTNFNAGTQDVFVTYPSEKGVWLDASGNAIGLGTPAAFVGTNITGTATALSIGGNAATSTTASAATGPLNGSLGATTPSTVVATTGSFTKATAGDVFTITNGGATPQPLYVYSGNGVAAISTGASGAGANVVFTPAQIYLQSPDQTKSILLSNTGTSVTGDLTTTGNTILGNASTDTLNVGNGDLIKDASGNLGLGVTPSAWASTNVLEIGSYGTWFGAPIAGVGAYMGSNNYYGSGGFTYRTTAAASYYTQSAGAHTWHSAPSGTAGTAATFTQVMTLDASGNLALGAGAGRSKFTSISGTDNTTADAAGFVGSFVGPTPSGQNSSISIESNSAIAADTGGVLAFGGRYSGTAYANWASIKGLKDNATSAEYGGYLSFYTRAMGANSAERMRIDSSGNVGIGVTPSAINSGFKNIQIFDATSIGIGGSGYAAQVSCNAYYASGGWTRVGASWGAGRYEQFNGGHAWYGDVAGAAGVYTPTQRMTLDASGNLLVGTTTAQLDGASRMVVLNTSGTVAEFTASSGTATQAVLRSWNTATSGDNLFQTFHTDAGATQRGSITYNRAGGLLAYNVTSDYRAKTVNGAVENALGKLALLKPCTGRMNGASEDIDFFVAHELQEVVPSAVSGIKDAVKEDGTPDYQAVDKSAIIPLLTAAIQEQQALITSLTARLEVLEAK